MKKLSTLVLLPFLMVGQEQIKDWQQLIRKDHPRMFFNVDTWPAVKARAVGVEAANWDKLLKAVESYPMEPTCSGYGPVQMGEVKTATGTIKITGATPIGSVQEWGVQAAQCAFAWRVTGNPAYLEKARKMLEVSVAAYREAYKNGRAVNWYSTTRVLALTAYDWIYEALTPEQRRAIIVSLVEHVEEVQPGPGKPSIIRRNTGGINTGFYGVDNLQWFSGLAAYGDGFCDELALKHLRTGYELNQKMLKYRADSSGDDGGLSSAVSGYCMGAYPWAHFNFMHTFLSATGVNVAQYWPQLALFPNWIYWNWIPDDNPVSPLQFAIGDTQHVDNKLDTWMLYQHMTQYMHFYKDADPAAARLAAALRNLAPNQVMDASWPMIPYLMTSVDDVQPYTQEQLENHSLKARHFESLGQFIMRSGWKPDSTYCLFISGARLTQHKHHDENHFMIYKKGFLALDSGTRGVETDHNLKYYYAQTVAHNCILIHKPNEPLPSYWGPAYNGPEGKINHGGMYDFSSRTMAFHTNDQFTYVCGDATKAYHEKCTECVRQFIHLQPDYFVVYDRVGASDPSYRKQWLLHTENLPTVKGRLLQTDERDGRLFCETLLPQDAVLELVGGPGKEFWANGRNWEVDSRFLENAQKRMDKAGRSTLFGQWRLEVNPAKANADDRFLHVLTAGDKSMTAPVQTRLLKSDTQDGVEIALPTGTVTIWFNRTGEIGGKIIIDGKTFELTNTIQPQAGVGL